MYIKDAVQIIVSRPIIQKKLYEIKHNFWNNGIYSLWDHHSILVIF